MLKSNRQAEFTTTITTTQWWQLVTSPGNGPASRFANVVVDFEKKSHQPATAIHKAA